MAAAGQSQVGAWVAALRPQQWIKNAFVLAPLLFGRQFNDVGMCMKAGLAFLSFCVASSAIYLFNDICDREEDRAHPVKRLRPIAAGRIGAGAALAAAAVLGLASVTMGWELGRDFVGMVILYVGVNVVYSVGMKHWAILDVMAIAAGFVLRILGGSVAIGAPASHWLVLCTIMISVFLGFTKRRAELISDHGKEQNTRVVLKDYSVAFLDQVIAMVTGATIICYALYTVDDRTLSVFGTRALLLTVPSVMYGIFRYIYIIYHLREGEDPTRTVLRDIPMLINLGIWVAISLVVVYYGESISLFD